MEFICVPPMIIVQNDTSNTNLTMDLIPRNFEIDIFSYLFVAATLHSGNHFIMALSNDKIFDNIGSENINIESWTKTLFFFERI